MNNRSGFTLIELIVVIVIIGILSTLGFTSYEKIQVNSHANRMAADFQQMQLGWKIWKNAHDEIWPDENLYGTSHPDLPCADEPGISQTPIILYLENKYKDPWNIEYSYDNDRDIFPTNGIEGGVNILASWCAGKGARYIEMAPKIDDSIDNGDGASVGRVRWSTDPNAAGSIIFMIAAAENQ